MPGPARRFHPVRALRVTDSSPSHLRGESRTQSLDVQALAPDVFRLVVRRRIDPPTRSWAVIGPAPHPAPAPDTPTTDTRTELRRGRAVVATAVARFTLHLATGAWDLVDRHGLELFRSAPGAMGFAGPSPRLTLQLAEREALFGLGESTGTFDKRGLIREFWNRDVLGHAPAIHPGLRSLYVAIPFALSLRDGRVAGLFWDNPARQTWDLGQTRLDQWQMAADSGPLDLYLFVGPTFPGILERYTQLTGRTPLPPRWALGYHQCRYSYASRTELERVAREFRRRQLPCDALYLDIHHLDGHRVFTFGQTFPDPAGMIRRLRRHGFKVVNIVDPGVKDERKFPVLKRGLERDAFVKDPTGRQDFIGEAWPGKVRFPDFLHADTRSWWGKEQAALQDLGVAGFWNDMNEPANFARADKTLDPRCLHRTPDGPRRHAEVHNVYGLEMARASHEGARHHRPDERPFIVTRAGYAGIQRHAVVWTGDNSSCWEHLADAVRMLLNLGLGGVPFVGADVGGFLDNTTPELFTRWLQMAVFTPFLRNHSNLDTIAQEPWAFGPAVESIARDFLHLRYQLLPYLYCLAAEAAATGAPLMRPLAWHYPNDPIAAACDDQFLLGPNLLVAPILRPGAVARSVYLPRGEWFDFWNDRKLSGGGHTALDAPPDRIPVLVRAGTVLPLTRPRPCVGPREPDTVALHVWPDDHGRLDWYDDDGHSLAHERGDWQRRTLLLTPSPRGGTLAIGPRQGRYPGFTRTWRIVLRGLRREVRVRVDGAPRPARFVPEMGLATLDVPTRAGATLIRWQ